MNTIKRHEPFNRYPAINKEEDFIDLEGATEQVEKVEPKKARSNSGKNYRRKRVAHKKQAASELSDSQLMWIIHDYYV